MKKVDLDAIKILRRLMSDEEIWVCKKCGSPRLEGQVWVDCNTEKVLDDVPDTDPWCDTCESHIDPTTVISLKEWKNEDIVYSTREKAIEDLALNENDILSHDDYIDILVNGCPGWKTMAFSDNDLINFYIDISIFFENHTKFIKVDNRKILRILAR